MAQKKRFYAVVRGKIPGIYTQWFGAGGAQEQVAGFPGARYKGFATKEEAQAFLSSGGRVARNPKEKKRKEPAAHEVTPFVATPDMIRVYTDGGCLNNPGPGGYGVVICRGEAQEELSGGFSLTTNNRMELLAVIKGLEAVAAEDRPVLVTSDSRYVLNGLEKGWAKGWRARGWKKADGNPALNPDLWERLLTLFESMRVHLNWVKGHAGHPENERCDTLAGMAQRGADLPPDTGYKP